MMNLSFMPSSVHAKQQIFWGFILFGITWCLLNFQTLSAGDDGLVRVVLGFVLACVVIFRGKEPSAYKVPSAKSLLIRALIGTVMHVLGLVFDVHQFQWLGFILLFSAGMSWSIDPAYIPDLNKGLFLLYWVHPLPGNFFGPMQIFFQKLSVLGSEWLLHCINFPAWADGMVLRAASGVFEVPAACSGMRTLVTVLMCVVGTAFIFRLSFISSIVFCVVGVIQVVLLNIIRISLMVWVSGSAFSHMSPGFLHDTAGVFLLMSVVLINLEILWWSRSRQREEHGSVRLGGDVLLLRFVRIGLFVTVGLILIAVVVMGIHKHNPKHWSAMVAQVAEGIEHKDPGSAERAMQEVIRRCPDDVSYRIQYARCLLAHQKYKEASLILDSLPTNVRDDNVNILRILALSGAGRSAESMQLIDEYSPSKMPSGIALTAAGIFAQQDKLQKCVACLLRAAENKALLPNIRRLYPYLAGREKWDVIASTDRNLPYADEQQLLAALKAHVMMGSLENAAELLRRNRSLWECKAAFVPLLAQMAVRSPSDQWRTDFGKCFRACLPDLSAEDMISYIEACFCMDRPDLASIGCSQLNKLIPEHPMINLLLAKYTRQLIDYRNGLLVDPSGTSTGSVTFAADMGFLAERIPANLSSKPADFEQFIRSNLRNCMSRCDDLIAHGQSSPHLLLVKADALELDHQPEAALAIMDKIKNIGPSGEMLITLRRARILYMEGRSHDAYEVLRRDSFQNLVWTDAVNALKIQLLQRLRLDFAALYEAVSGLHKYPASPALRSMCAMLWDAHGYTDEALFVMKQARSPESSRLMVNLLDRTGRGGESQVLRSQLGLPKAGTEPVGIVQFPPAERAVIWLPGVTTNAEKQVFHLPVLSDGDKISPFIASLHSAELAWRHANDGATGADLQAWENCGRDPLEKATALHRLAVLAVGRNDRVSAIAALDRALVLLPDSAILWRMRISLANGDMAKIQLARQILPEDPEIWLASIITLVRSACKDDVLLREIGGAASHVRYPSETLLRAGDYLLRAGRVKPAVVVSRSVLQREKSLASAYALNMNCALADGDEMSALKYTLTARESLPSEPIFLKNIVRLKMKLAQNDAVLVDCLTQLVSQFPKEQEWNERLGAVYFEAGNMERAFKAFSPVMSGSTSSLQAGVCILMAEAARQVNRCDLSVNLLRRALKMYPDNTTILNNLVYSLASSRETLSEAGRLLPLLLGKKDINASTYDSAAFASFRLHQPDKADEYLKQALSMLNPEKDKKWYEYALNAAETAMAEGLRDDAKKILQRIQVAPRQDLIPKARLQKITDQLE